MMVEIKSRQDCEEKRSTALEILDDIFAKSTRTPIHDLIEGLLNQVTGLPPNNANKPTARPKATHAPQSLLESSAHSSSNSDSDSHSDTSSISSSSTTSSSSSNSSSEREANDQIRKAELARIVQESKAEDDGKHLRSKNEVDPENVPVPTPTIVIREEDEIVPVGKIVSAMESVVVVSTADWRPNEEAKTVHGTHPKTSPLGTNLNSVSALDHGSGLCFGDRRFLGVVDETFGPVECPFYVVRFNTVKERDATGAKEGRMVYLVKQKSKWVRGSDVLSKGYDTSNWDDEECNGPVEFSDDEDEKAAKQAQRRARTQRRENGMDNANEQKRRRLSTSYPAREMSNPAEQHVRTVRRGSQRGRLGPRYGRNPNAEHKNGPRDTPRYASNHATAPVRNTAMFGNQLQGESSAALGMHGMDPVASSEVYARAGYSRSHSVPNPSGVYSGSHPNGAVPPAPNGLGQQFYHHHGLSQMVSPVHNPFAFTASGLPGALPGANVGVPHQSRAQGHYVNHGVNSSQHQYHGAPTPYWFAGMSHQMYPQTNTAELRQNNSFYAGPVDNQSRTFYGGPVPQQLRYEEANHQVRPPSMSPYSPVGFASYASGAGRPMHMNVGPSPEQHQQETTHPPPPQGRR